MTNSLTLQWLGTAGFAIRFRAKTILLDPYISRVPDRMTPIVPDSDRLARLFPTVDLVVVSHSHFDHLADAPTIARSTKAVMLGSSTTINIARSFGVPEQQLRQVNARDCIEFSDFSVCFLPSLHGVNPTTMAVPNPGVFESPPAVPPRTANDYKEGGTFAPLFDFSGYRILQIGSANFLESAIRGVHVDTLLLCIAWREMVTDFVKTVLECTTPRIVVPIHFDNFWLPLENGVVAREDTSIDEFEAEVRGIDSTISVRRLDYFEKFDVSAHI